MPEKSTIILFSYQEGAGQELTNALAGSHFVVAGITDSIDINRKRAIHPSMLCQRDGIS